MRVQTFMAKVSVEALRELDEHINDWLKKNEVEPKIVTQTFGTDVPRDGRPAEAILITSVWY